jgi:hypothetical protein
MVAVYDRGRTGARTGALALLRAQAQGPILGTAWAA